MTGSPLVTIVLPVYNGARYLPEAIASCLAQTYANFELIIVDDASTDETPEIVRKFVLKDSRIRTIRHTTNLKLPAALNTGFGAAKGELLSWTSDDNRYLPNALEVMVDALERHTDKDVAYADYSVINDAGELTTKVSVDSPVYLVRSNIVGPCFLYRKAVQEKLGGYDQALFLVEDYDFWLRAAAEFRLFPIHQELYCYRWHDMSLSSRQAMKVSLQHELALRKNLPCLRWLPAQAAVAGWSKVAVMARRRGDWRSCGEALLRAFYVSPIAAGSLWIRIVSQGTTLISHLRFD